MKFKIRMVPNPGDRFITKGVITKIDVKGVESVEQMILEGETVEVDCIIGAGEALLVKELPPPLIIEDMATKPMTWEDVRDRIPVRPSGPTQPSSPRPDNTLPEAPTKEHEKTAAKK